MIEIITLVAGGREWNRWTRASVSYGARDSIRAFAFTIVDAAPFLHQWDFMPGTECEVYAGDDLIVKGYINTMSPSFDANNHKVEISGKSKSQDTARASAKHDKSEFKDKTILDIAKELDKQGVGFTTTAELKKHKIFRLNQGETVFEALDRLARKDDLLLIGKPDGSIEIAKGGTRTGNAPIVEGYNLKGGSATFSDEAKHSEYTVKGQRAFGTKSGSLRVEATAKDKTVKRNIPKIILPEADTNKKDAKDRAKRYRDNAQSASVGASLQCVGWRDSNGSLWLPNTLTYIDSPTLKLNMSLLLESVSLTQDQSGTLAQLSYKQPKGEGSSAKTGAKTDAAWDYDPGEDNDNETDEADPDE